MRLALALTLLAAPAQADVFDRAAGLWGRTDDPELSCAANPHRVSFSADRSRASFLWQGTMINYLGEPDLEGGYDVRGSGSDEIVLALDGEQRLTEDGAPVVWIMRLIDGDARYCWARTDWPPEDCVDRYVRCPEPPPIS